MLESEYYEIRTELLDLKFRVPQYGIKFKYGKFSVQTGYNTDMFGKIVYLIYKSSDTFWEKNLFLYPLENNDDTGFLIRDTDMSFADIKEFIHTIKNKDNPSEVVFKRVNTHEGFLKQLIYDAKYQCAICLDNYTAPSDVTILSCSHHFHSNCITEYIINKPCPVCRIHPVDNI